MSTEAVTDISTDERKAPSERAAVGLMLSEALFNSIKQDSKRSKTPIGTMVERWIDKNVSLQDVSIGLASLMNSTYRRIPFESYIGMKKLTVTLSKRHYNMVKMEAIRQQTTIRGLLKGWIEEITQEFRVVATDSDNCQVNAP